MGDDGTACNPLGEGTLTGVIALVVRSSDKCQFLTKVQNVQRAGAIGVIIYQSEANANGTFPIRGLEETAIPAGLIGNQSGVALKNYISRESGATATLDPNYKSTPTQEFDTVAVFSSRGPAIRTDAIKPELLAVGTDIYTGTQTYDPNGELYDPSGYTAVQGSSYAAPIVAGVVAMVKKIPESRARTSNRRL